MLEETQSTQLRGESLNTNVVEQPFVLLTVRVWGRGVQAYRTTRKEKQSQLLLLRCNVLSAMASSEYYEYAACCSDIQQLLRWLRSPAAAAEGVTVLPRPHLFSTGSR